MTFFDTSYSEREYFPWFNIDPLPSWERFLVNNQQVLFFAVLLLPLIGMQNPSPSVVTLVLQEDLQELLCCCNLNQSRICLIIEKF